MKKKNGRERLVAILACVLVLLMLLPMVLTLLTSFTAKAASVNSIQSQITQLKDKEKNLASQKATMDAKLKSIQSTKSTALQKKSALEQQMAVIQDQIDNLTNQINQYGLLIGEKEIEIAETKVQEEEQYQLFCQRVRVMEETPTVSYWSILFASNSFSQLLDSINVINAIMDYDQAVANQLLATRQQLEAAQVELETAQADVEVAKTQQEAAKGELKTQAVAMDAVISEITDSEKDAQEALDDLEDAATQMDSQIAKKEAELEKAIVAARKAEEARQAALAAGKNPGPAGNTYQFDPGTGYYWPLPANRVTITSFFGPRYHPINKKYHTHTGTDIAAPRGTNIYAAHGGIVLTSAYNSSYGNYVVLSRGDGVTTLYAHMNTRAVSEGQSVAQGQVIGYVGTTGSSTGYHLHFELRMSGVRKDALAYYPSLNWVNSTGYNY